MTQEQYELFNLLQSDREENAKVLEKTSMRGVKRSITEKYSEQAHFIYELLQNADDAKATKVRFVLDNNGLLFAHNGTVHFSISDPKTEEKDKENGELGHINSITSIGNTTKFESQIGKFGIGFKSVFQYTNTPHIYDPPFMFKIERLIVPVSLDCDHPERIGYETLFYFPFDSEKGQLEKAYEEVGTRLQKLDNPLLFLRYLQRIEWKDNQGNSGIYLRRIKLQDVGRIILLRAKVNVQSAKNRFLIFDKEIPSSENTNVNHTISIAFRLSLEKELKISSERKFPAYCFFATREPTELRFIIQAPFLLTDSREGIKQGKQWNEYLIEQAAELVAESLVEVRNRGLLDIDFLNTLPISRKDFSEDRMFRPIFDALLRKLESDEKLLPANDGGHISANQALLARSKDLINLLGTKQLSLMFEKEDCQWLDSKITETSILWDYLNKELEIPAVRPDIFASHFDKTFVEQQDYKWIIDFYAFLLKHEDLWNNTSSILRKKEIIRLSNQTHVSPFDENGNLRAYLPSGSHSEFPLVEQNIANDKKAQEFLRKLGLYEPDQLAEMINHVLPRYLDSEVSVSKEENILHIQQIAQVLQPDSLTKSQEDLIPKLKMLSRKIGLEELINNLDKTDIPPTRLIQAFKPIIFKEIPFLLSINNTNRQSEYKKPNEIYLSSEYTGNDGLECFLEANPDIWLLDKCYLNIPDIKIIIENLHILDKPKITTEEFNTNKKYKRGFTRDYTMDGLQFFLEHNKYSIKTSLYLWELLIRSQRDNSYRIELKGTLEHANDEKFIGKNVKKEPKVTTIYKLLNNYSWLPDKYANFHKPSDISLSELPDDFEKESIEAKKLAESLGFQPDIEKQLEASLPSELRVRWKIFSSLNNEEIHAFEQFLSERKAKSQFPEHLAPNKARREEKARESYVSSEEKKSEKRERTVRISQDQIDRKTALREWYQDENEKVICQICKSPSSFKNQQGKYYFEAIEMVRDEKEKEYDPNALALCPLCSAKYLYGERTDDEKIKQKLIILYDDFKNGILSQENLKIIINLCDKTVDIRFVEKHLIDLSPSFITSQNNK